MKVIFSKNKPIFTEIILLLIGQFSMPIHILQCVFHLEKLLFTHRFFYKYEQTRTEKFAHALLLILMQEVYLQRSMMLS